MKNEGVKILGMNPKMAELLDNSEAIRSFMALKYEQVFNRFYEILREKGVEPLAIHGEKQNGNYVVILKSGDKSEDDVICAFLDANFEYRESGFSIGVLVVDERYAPQFETTPKIK